MAELYFSSASALGKTSYAYVLIDGEYMRGRGITNENRIITEYQGLNKGLSLALDKDMRKLMVFGPRLIIDQLRGNVPVRSHRALPLYNEARALLSIFRKVELSVVSHAMNKAFPLAIESLKEFFEGKSIAKSREIPDRRIEWIKGLKFVADQHIVDLGRESCSCKFFSETNSLDVKRAGMVIRCRHIFTVERFVSK